MSEFCLIDLVQQASSIAAIRRFSSYDQLLSWLRVYGEVRIDPQRPRYFRFREWWSLSGKYFDLFRYEDDGSLWFYGDHCVIVLWPS